MTWKIRHEGSPRALEGLTQAMVIEGLQDGLWEPTDEIMGPNDQQWVAIENHPQLEEIVADLEHPLEKPFDEETRLDMNPMIDVALVLLIFFIITTSYAALQKVLDMPNLSPQKAGKLIEVAKADVEKFTVYVKARKENGRPVIRVEQQPVAREDLVDALRGYVNRTHKTEVLIDAYGVDWGTVVAIQDAAKGAGVEKAHLQANPEP